MKSKTLYNGLREKAIYGTLGNPPEKEVISTVKFEEIGTSSDTWGGSGMKPGATITGKLVEIAENSNNEEMVDYILETGKGRIRVWGSAILCRRLGTEMEKHPYLGKTIRLTYKGKVNAKRGKAYDYKVEIAK